MSRALYLVLADAIDRLDLPHADDGRRKRGTEAHHARSIASLAACGLVPDAGTARYLHRAAVADGLAIALPDVSDEIFQLVLDWTNHNCLLDDAVERHDIDIYAVADLCRRYTSALAGAPEPREALPLAQAMVAWRRRALAAGLDSGLLEEFVRRAGQMASQFALERMLEQHEMRIDGDEYLRHRVYAGPFDAWFALLDLARGPAHRPQTEQARTLRTLAKTLTVIGNELRTLGRELDQCVSNNFVIRAADPEAAILHLHATHNARARSFRQLAERAPDDAHRAYADSLARAVYATHIYETRSIRGLAWA